jgi:ketosteroid isomerase-like protein
MEAIMFSRKQLQKTLLFSLFLLLAMAAVVVVGNGLTPSVAAADTGRESQIREASEAWDDAFNAEELDALMALYADEAVSMPPGFPALEGKQAIRSDFEYIFANFDWEHETTIVDLLMSGNVAVERGAYTMSEGGTVFETGKHIVVRQKHGNAWRVVLEIWNTNG